MPDRKGFQHFSFGLVVVALALWTGTGWGQTFYGSISGTVLDATGAAVPGAAVTLTNLGTTEKRSMETDVTGSYQFVNLVPTRYRIEAEKSGFKRFVREPIVIEVQQAIRIDISLEVGAVTQTVEVTAQTPLLQPQTSSLGQVVESRKVTEMPLNGRNILALAALVPGVVPQGGRENSSTRNPTGTNIFAWGNIQIWWGNGQPECRLYRRRPGECGLPQPPESRTDARRDPRVQGRDEQFRARVGAVCRRSDQPHDQVGY